MPSKPGQGQKLTIYDFGRTTTYACQLDQRFPYCLYVPKGYEEAGSKAYALAVIVHGTERGMAAYRDAFADFAEANDCIVLAPLFPCGITEPYELSSYKLLRAGALHYDAVLLAMVDEVAARYRLEGERFLLYGFSGGGHFSHRFFYLHPERLLGVSIGAPGVVTLFDENHDYWVGVRDFEERFGKALNPEAMRSVPVQMVIGEEDRETWEITITPKDAWWMEGADLAGRDRQDRMLALKASFERQGIAVRHDKVAGAGHDGSKVLAPVKAFFAAVLAERRGSREAAQ